MNAQAWVGPSDVEDIRDVEAMAEALVVLAEQIPLVLANVARANRRLDSDAVMATLHARAKRLKTPTTKCLWPPQPHTPVCTARPPRTLPAPRATTSTRCS